MSWNENSICNNQTFGRFDVETTYKQFWSNAMTYPEPVDIDVESNI